MTNHMSVSDKLAMKLKESELGSLLAEDDIIMIAREAIEKAFFKPRVDSSGYKHRTMEPLVVEMARELFRTEFQRIVRPVIHDLTNTTEFRTVLAAAISHELPSMMLGMSHTVIHEQAQKAMSAALSNYDFVRQLKDAMGKV